MPTSYTQTPLTAPNWGPTTTVATAVPSFPPAEPDDAEQTLQRLQQHVEQLEEELENAHERDVWIRELYADLRAKIQAAVGLEQRPRSFGEHDVVIEEILTRISLLSPSLDALLTNYLALRKKELSFAALPPAERLAAQANYVRGEAQELLDAVNDWIAGNPEGLKPVRLEVGDVALAVTTFARYLDAVAVEECIAEKTEADRGRG
jgi:NTP pyrophosphatase (non-canonical NTP hydrolase)